MNKSNLILVVATVLLTSCTTSPVKAVTNPIGAVANELSRVPHDHTIYVLRGDPEQLRRFEHEIGTDWSGGELLSKDETGRAYTYWAYSERTAAQARAFMMPAAFAGFEMEVLAYDDAEAFPNERERLDKAATSCGFETDPFLILPNGRLQLLSSENPNSKQIACIIQAVASQCDLPEFSTPNVGVQTYRAEEVQ